MPQKKLSYEDWKKKYNKTESPEYKLKKAYDLGYTPDRKGHLPTVDEKTGEFLKSSKHPTVRKELDWYNSKEAASFREKNKIDSTEEFWKYVPKLKEGGKMPLKKKYQSGGGIHKGYPAPAKQPVIKQGGGPTRETIRQDKLAESRRSYESGSKRIKAGISVASNIPVVGKYAQAIGVGADLGAGLAKAIRGESGAKRDFSQAAVGSVALANPFKGVGPGFKKAKAFLKSAELSNDISDIAEGASTYKKGGKMPLKKASGKGKAAVQKAVSANIAELTRANREKPAGKKRSKEQIAAIAYSAARKK